jgi:hypothetical protein
LALCTGHLKEAKELGRLGARRAFYFFIADNLAVSTGMMECWMMASFDTFHCLTLRQSMTRLILDDKPIHGNAAERSGKAVPAELRGSASTNRVAFGVVASDSMS